MTGGGHEITHKSLAQILQQILRWKGVLYTENVRGVGGKLYPKTEFN
jgi:hypothetical protein